MKTMFCIQLMLVLLGLSFALHAQEGQDEDQEEDKKVKYHYETIAAIGRPLKNTDFFIAKVIDNRAIKDSIGFALKGPGNRHMPAQFYGPFSFYLHKVFNALLPSLADKEALIVKINQLQISEKVYGTYELGRCEVEMEFVKYADGRHLSLGTFRSEMENKAADATTKHSKRLLLCIKSCIKQFSESNWKSKPPIPAVVSGFEEKEYRFDEQQPLKMGLYLDFMDFIQNDPVDSIPYMFSKYDESEKTMRYQVYHAGTDKRVKKLFGFSDGKNMYLNANIFGKIDPRAGQYLHSTTLGAPNYFIKSEFFGRYIFFTDRLASAAAGAVFGLAGTIASIHRVGIVLDTRTGYILVLTYENLATILSPYPELLALYNRSDKKYNSVRKLVEKLNALEK